MLHAPVLFPLDEFAAKGHKLTDLYLVAFLPALTAPAKRYVETTLAAGQPVHLIHPLPEAWARPSKWVPLDNLALKSECADPLIVEIGGQNAEREFVTARLELPPKKRVLLEQTFYSLAYIHATNPPETRLGLYSPVHAQACIIGPHEWGNIRVQRLEILLTGWFSHEEFRRQASLLNAGMATFQYARTRMKNLLLPVAELNPLGELFERVRTWKAQNNPV